MYYIKVNVANKKVKIKLKDDKFYTKCKKCGKEINLQNSDMGNILNYGSMLDTDTFCEECSKHKKW